MKISPHPLLVSRIWHFHNSAWIHWVAIIISYLLFLIIGLVMNALDTTGQTEYWAFEHLMSDPWSYLTVILVSVVSVLPRLVITLLYNILSPTEWYQIRRKLFHQNAKSRPSLTVEAYY